MFIDDLRKNTDRERQQLFSIPSIQDALRGKVTHARYLAFLTEAYHHVRHTVPLLMSCGSHLPDRLTWVRDAVIGYIEEEAGHEEWILSDIDQAGGNSAVVRRSQPGLSTEIMIAYAYDSIRRRNPMSFFGMAHVLEGTSVQLATRAAEVLRSTLKLPEAAFSYLTSHGSLDIEHTRTFAELVNRLETNEDRDAVIHSAKAFYRLYGDVFRGIEWASA